MASRIILNMDKASCSKSTEEILWDSANKIRDFVEPSKYKHVVLSLILLKFIERHKVNKKDVSIYGQELPNTTYKLAKMNLAIRGISSNLVVKATNTFGDDQHKDLKAIYIIAILLLISTYNYEI